MRTSRENHFRLAKTMALAVTLALLVANTTMASLNKGKPSPKARAAKLSPAPEKYLFIWAGDQARQAPDFLAVVDFDEASAAYGQVLTTLPLPGTGASGNEPHHVGLSSDKNVLACGGLLSVLKGQNEIFFFDVSNPTAPRFLSSANPPLSAITDDFYPLRDGGFLTTIMGTSSRPAPRPVS